MISVLRIRFQLTVVFETFPMRWSCSNPQSVMAVCHALEWIIHFVMRPWNSSLCYKLRNLGWQRLEVMPLVYLACFGWFRQPWKFCLTCFRSLKPWTDGCISSVWSCQSIYLAARRENLWLYFVDGNVSCLGNFLIFADDKGGTGKNISAQSPCASLKHSSVSLREWLSWGPPVHIVPDE